MTLAACTPAPPIPAPWISVTFTNAEGQLEWDFLAVDGASLDGVVAETNATEFGDVRRDCHAALDEFLDRVHTTSTAISFAVLR